jgi:AcrR family transcriptional regulator
VARPSRAVRSSYDLDDIVEIAMRVFLERGYDGTSMEDLARAAGITKSSFYYHVSGKEELLERGVTRALDALFGVLDEPAAIEGRAVDRLRHIVRRMAEIVTERLPEVALLVRATGNTETETRALERRREFDRAVARLMRQAIRDGDVRAAAEPAIVTRLVLGMAVSVIGWYRPDGNVRPAALVAAVEDVAFRGLLADRADPAVS